MPRALARGLLPVAAAIAIVSAAPAAAAEAVRARPWETPDRAVHWNCEPEHDEYHHIRCEEGPAPPSAGGPAGRTDVLAFVDRHDPLLVQARESAATAPRAWRIPLYSAPFSDRDAEQLARAVLCGRSARCTLTLDRRSAPQGLPPAPLRISATPP